jgi:ABC-type bacteriocin/lantibiotic exporter with double-glycine peptidase domain
MPAPPPNNDTGRENDAVRGVANFAAAAAPHLHSHVRPGRKLAELLAPESADVRLIVLFAAAVGLLNLASPIAVEALVNSVAFGGLLQPIVVLAMILAACLTLSAAMSALQYYIIELIQRRVFVRIFDRLLGAFPGALRRVWDEQDPGTAANRFFEIMTIQKLVSLLLLDGIAIILTAVIGMIVLAFYHPVLLAFDVVFLLAILVLLAAGARVGPRTAVAESLAKHTSAAWLEQVACEHRSFRSRSGSALAHAVGRTLAVRYLTARSAHFRVVFRQLVGGLALQVTAVVTMLGIGGWLVLVGQMTLGQLVAAELIVAAVTGSVAKLGKYLESFYDLLASVDKLAPFDELPRETVGGEAPPGDVKGADLGVLGITLENARRGRVLVDWHLKAGPGESVAVLAGEGRGKSLLARVLTADCTPAAGAVELDGVDLRRWNLAELRERVCLVDGRGLLEGTIEDNIATGRIDVTPDDVRAALAAVNLLEAVRELPDELNTVLDRTGGPLSTGETRRLLLARALVGRPRLLILDSCFDQFEAADQLAIWRNIRHDYPATVLLLTSRPSTARLCDRWVTIGLENAPPKEEVDA